MTLAIINWFFVSRPGSVIPMKANVTNEAAEVGS